MHLTRSGRPVRQGGVYRQISGFQIRRGSLPSGDLGTRKTLEAMRQLAVQGSKTLEVREAAINAVRDAGVGPHAPVRDLGALFRFVRDRIRFTNDIVDVETVQSPRYTLHMMAGDCDDRAVLLAAMARSIGIPADLSFRVVAATPGTRRFSHVYVVASLGGRKIPLDPTYPENEPGREYARSSRMGDFRL